MKRIATPLFFLLIIIVAQPASAWRETMHRDKLTFETLALVQQANQGQEYSKEIWETYRAYIMQGAHDEDWPTERGNIYEWNSLTLLCRANNHYRHAISGTGLTCTPVLSMGDPDEDALTWALTNPHLTEAEEFRGGEKWALRSLGFTPQDVNRGNMSWVKAINRYGYTENEKKLAYYTLGFILHLLQDMGCCEHVHDDPHAGSGFTGYEKYVEVNWERLKPDRAGLKPRDLPKVRQYFDRLARIGYSSNRFRGWNGGRGSQPTIDPGSDLARMFEIDHTKESVQQLDDDPFSGPLNAFETSETWCLLNAGESRTSAWRLFCWNPSEYLERPTSHKAYDDGHFWPTCQEMAGVPGNPANDEPGFFYIELSDDLEAGDSVSGLSKERRLYPHAYLPTPLAEVAGECGGWSKPALGGKVHLYEVIGRAVFPAVISYSAGLVRHYFDIVNPPPFVQAVRVHSGEGVCYSGIFEDQLESWPGPGMMKSVTKRKLADAAEETCVPGDFRIQVDFSEPVELKGFRVGDRTLKAESARKGRTWHASFAIPEEGPAVETLQVEIEARDFNAHYGDQGGTLDADPRTPALRRINGQRYQWWGYEPGVDRNHRITVERPEDSQESGWYGIWKVRSTHLSGPDKKGKFHSTIEVRKTAGGDYVFWGKNKWTCTISGNTLEFNGKHPSGGKMKWTFVRNGNKLVEKESTFKGYIRDEPADGIYEGQKQ